MSCIACSASMKVGMTSFADLEAMLDKDGDADFASLKVRIQALASDVNKHISAGAARSLSEHQS